MKPGLFFYESVRFLLLAAFVLFMPGASEGFSKLALIAPQVLFPLMALFLWLDISIYKAYLPLLAAGKCITIISLAGWSIAFRRVTITSGLSGDAAAELIFLSGDLFAMAAILLMIRDKNKLTETQALEDK